MTTTILHCSDVHFGPPHRPRAAAALAAMVAAERPTALVISGDLTQRAKPAQFDAARAWVERIEVPTVLVPGNHDVPMYRFWERFGAPYRAWSRLGRPRESELSVPGAWFAGIDTSRSLTIKHGRVAGSRLAAVCAAAAAAPADAIRIAVAHHPLAPPPRFGEQRVAGGARGAVDALRRAGFELVLGGHEHRFWVARAEDYWGGPAGLLHVHSGTSSSSRGREPEVGRCSAVRLTVTDATIEVTRLLFDDSAARFVDDLSARFPRVRRQR